MSGVTHTHTPIEQVLLRDQRRAKIIAAAAVTALAALLVTLVLVLDGGNSPTVDTQQPAAQEAQEPSAQQLGAYPSAAVVPPSMQPGTRYDGGPEEGTRGIGGSSTANPGRPDGGPEEGTVGPGH
jgi:hypothetical protein